MKETNKPTRIFCIAWILCNLIYLCAIMFRSHLYDTMIHSDFIQEEMIFKIDLMDMISEFTKHTAVLLAFAMILYLAERLIHTALKKDCRFAFLSLVISVALSFAGALIFRIPQTTAFASLTYLPYVLVALVILVAINSIKKRFLASLSQ